MGWFKGATAGPLGVFKSARKVGTIGARSASDFAPQLPTIGGDSVFGRSPTMSGIGVPSFGMAPGGQKSMVGLASYAPPRPPLPTRVSKPSSLTAYKPPVGGAFAGGVHPPGAVGLVPPKPPAAVAPGLPGPIPAAGARLARLLGIPVVPSREEKRAAYLEGRERDFSARRELRFLSARREAAARKHRLGIGPDPALGDLMDAINASRALRLLLGR